MPKYKEPLQRVMVAVLLLSSLSAVPPGTYAPIHSSTVIRQFIDPDLSQWPQSRANWCGPATLQAAIDYAWKRVTPNPPPMYSQPALWDYMKNSRCYDAGGGRDAALPGTVGDGNNDVRKLNIAYDFGVDPHAMTWTMLKLGPSQRSYHYWVYNSVWEATRWLLYTLEEFSEPTFAAVLNGSHWVLVIGYEADYQLFPRTDPGTIYQVRYADPLVQKPADPRQWKSYSNWTTSYFTRHTDSHDPDPATGWNIAPPDHWRNKWVTIEQDAWYDYNPDWGMTMDPGPPTHQPLTYLPKVRGSYNGWNSIIVIRNNAGTTTNASITFYDGAGVPMGTLTSTPISAGGVLVKDVSSVVSGFSGSAVVAASGDLAVVLEEQNSNPGQVRASASNGLAASDPLNPDWGQVGTDVHLPLLMKDNYGWSTSVTLLNTGNAQANYDLDCFGQNSGGPWHVAQDSLTPQASTTFEQSGSVCPTVGAGRITSDQPLAVIVTQKYSYSPMAASYNGVAAGATTVNLPLIMANNWVSGVQVHNLDGAIATVVLRTANGREYRADVGAYQSVNFYQPGDAGFRGPATVTCTNGRWIAAVVDITGSGAGDVTISYNGVNR